MKYSPDADVLVKQIGEETVLIHLGTDRVLHTNLTGSRVWSLLAEGHADSDIVALLGAEYQRPDEQIQDEVAGFLKQLVEEGLVKPADSRE